MSRHDDTLTPVSSLPVDISPSSPTHVLLLLFFSVPCRLIRPKSSSTRGLSTPWLSNVGFDVGSAKDWTLYYFVIFVVSVGHSRDEVSQQTHSRRRTPTDESQVGSWRPEVVWSFRLLVCRSGATGSRLREEVSVVLEPRGRTVTRTGSHPVGYTNSTT